MEIGDEVESFKAALDDYQQHIGAWLDAAKKQTAAVNRLQKAVASGNVRDVEKLRQNALNAMEATLEKARLCAPFTFDIENYLRDGYLDELRRAAENAGVQMFERDGTIFCYPSLVRLEPELNAVRIDKKLDANIRPDVLASVLKKAQSRDSKAKPERFIETLYDAYELLRASKKIDHSVDLLVKDIYKILTLLPGANIEYTMLDFTRDLYFLDTSGIFATKKGHRLSWASSTISRENPKNILTFVTRDGHEKQYAAIKFTTS